MPEQLQVYNLWGEDFKLPDQNAEDVFNRIKHPLKVSKQKTPEQLLAAKNTSIEEKLAIIEKEVYKKLGPRAAYVGVIKSYEELVKYIDKAIFNGYIAIDTETNKSLDPLTCKLVGPCLYTPGEKQVYIPLHHRDYKTKEEWSWQLNESQINTQFQRLKDNNVKIIWHNYVFDYRVIKCTCDIGMPIYWETQVAAKLLNENESAKLKDQYSLHIDPDQDKYSIEGFFKYVDYEDVPPELFALYAATDAYDTYKLYEWQYPQLTSEDMKDVYKLYREIEIPILDVVSDMELRGISVDTEYAKKLSAEYHKRSDLVQTKIDQELLALEDKIEAWKHTPDANKLVGKKNKKRKWEQLDNPISLGSNTQLSILLYDIMKVPVVDDSTPRGTGEEILEELANVYNYKLCKLMLEKRELDKQLTTFIDKLLTMISPATGRLHPSYNSTGTKTGRFSSSGPNLQQIPSYIKEIRMMFKASEGCSIVGADYGAQEVRIMASLANDKEMIKAYEENKDLYAVIGSKIYHNKYEDNLEFNPTTHELQLDGKERRSKSKSFLLGLNYGMSDKGLAERLHVSLDEAKAIKDDFYKGFTGLKSFSAESREMAQAYGYVTTRNGRRRHLPEALLPEYSVDPVNAATEFNPFLDVVDNLGPKNRKLVEEYRQKISNAKYYKDKVKITEEAKNNGFEIKSNKSAINRALRQCINSRAQGTAAEMTKVAMIKVDNDPVMKGLGFKLLVTVHDEMFGECPRENSAKAAERLSQLMIEVAQQMCPNVP